MITPSSRTELDDDVVDDVTSFSALAVAEMNEIYNNDDDNDFLFNYV